MRRGGCGSRVPWRPAALGRRDGRERMREALGTHGAGSHDPERAGAPRGEPRTARALGASPGGADQRGEREAGARRRLMDAETQAVVARLREDVDTPCPY